MEKPKAIIFDWDLTLVDTLVIFEKIGYDLSEKFNIDYEFYRKLSSTYLSAKDLFPIIFGPQAEQAKLEYYKLYMEFRAHYFKAKEGAEQLLKLIKDHSIYLAIVSNKNRVYLNDEVKLLNWEDYFDKIIGSGDASFDKPHIAPVEAALVGSPVTLEDKIWFIGDSIVDMKTASNIKATSILIGEDPSLIPEEYKPNMYFANFHELKQFIEESFVISY